MTITGTFAQFYIASDDPGAHGNPGLVLYRTLTSEERAAARAEGSHLDGDPWSIWLTEDVLAVAEASGLLNESIGTSAESARKWLQEDAKADQIRNQIAYLEGELSRLSGESILLWDGIDGGTDYAETPPGGALVEYRTGMIEQAWRRWYGSTEAAKAALVALQREHGGAVEKSGLQWIGPRDLRAWITRR